MQTVCMKDIKKMFRWSRCLRKRLYFPDVSVVTNVWHRYQEGQDRPIDVTLEVMWLAVSRALDSCVYFSEINRVRIALFHNPGLELKLPEPQGPPVTLSEKIYVPVKDHPEVSLIHQKAIYVWLFNVSGVQL